MESDNKEMPEMPEIAMVLDSYPSPAFDETKWRALWQKAGGEYAKMITRPPFNFLMNPQEQLAKVEEGKPMLIFLLRPETIRDRVKRVVETVARGLVFERTGLTTKFKTALKDQLGVESSVRVRKKECDLIGSVRYQDEDELVTVHFTISNENKGMN